MDFHNCVLRHAGNLGMTIHKENISAPEIVVLQMVHGPDAVTQIEKVRSGIPTEHRAERDRLAAYYGDKVVEAAFPGLVARLPNSLAEAGIRMANEPEEVDDDPASDRVMAPPADVAAKIARAKSAQTAQSLVG